MKRQSDRKSARKTRKSKRARKASRKTRIQRGGDWKIPSYSTVIWRDRKDDPYSPPIVTSKETQSEMTEYD